jgi:hypothetical protein
MPRARRREGVDRYGGQSTATFNINDVVIINGARFSNGLDSTIFYVAIIVGILPVNGSSPRYSIQYLDGSFDEVDSTTLRMNDPSLVPSMVLFSTPFIHGASIPGSLHRYSSFILFLISDVIIFIGSLRYLYLSPLSIGNKFNHRSALNANFH